MSHQRWLAYMFEGLKESCIIDQAINDLPQFSKWLKMAGTRGSLTGSHHTKSCMIKFKFTYFLTEATTKEVDS